MKVTKIEHHIFEIKIHQAYMNELRVSRHIDNTTTPKLEDFYYLEKQQKLLLFFFYIFYLKFGIYTFALLFLQVWLDDFLFFNVNYA